jgi:hypothetical protein
MAARCRSRKGSEGCLRTICPMCGWGPYGQHRRMHSNLSPYLADALKAEAVHAHHALRAPRRTRRPRLAALLLRRRRRGAPRAGRVAVT